MAIPLYIRRYWDVKAYNVFDHYRESIRVRKSTDEKLKFSLLLDADGQNPQHDNCTDTHLFGSMIHSFYNSSLNINSNKSPISAF